MRRSKGFSLIELLLVVAIILIIAAIAIPRMLQARIAANEASSASTIRTITNAQIVYMISSSSYANDLDALGPSGVGILDSAISSAPYERSGYVFSTTGDATGFRVFASPAKPGSSGVRTFCTSTPAYIKYRSDGSACDPTDPTIPVL